MPFAAASSPPSSSLMPTTCEKDGSWCMGAGDVRSLTHEAQTSCFVHKEVIVRDFVFS